VIDGWILPGLVLGVVFGLGSIVTLWGVRTRTRGGLLDAVERITGHHWAWSATILIGVGQSVWIALELIWPPEVSLLQPLYGTVGIALAFLPWTPSARPTWPSATDRTPRVRGVRPRLPAISVVVAEPSNHRSRPS
jgi:hypothetical protein